MRYVGMVADSDRAGSGERGMAGYVHEVADGEGGADREDTERVDPNVRADPHPLAAHEHAGGMDPDIVTHRGEPQPKQLRAGKVFLVEHGFKASGVIDPKQAFADRVPPGPVPAGLRRGDVEHLPKVEVCQPAGSWQEPTLCGHEKAAQQRGEYG